MLLHGTRAEGEILETSTMTDDEGDVYYIHTVGLILPNTEQVKFEHDVKTTRPQFNIGDRVRVAYIWTPGSNVIEGRILDFWSFWFTTVMFIIFASVFGIIGALTWKSELREKQAD